MAVVDVVYGESGAHQHRAVVVGDILISRDTGGPASGLGGRKTWNHIIHGSCI